MYKCEKESEKNCEIGREWKSTSDRKKEMEPKVKFKWKLVEIFIGTMVYGGDYDGKWVLK